MRIPSVFVVAAAASLSCGGGSGAPPVPKAPPSGGDRAAPSFAEDVKFLEAHGPIQVLDDGAGGKVVVSAKYQGRVMTSAVEPSGRSLGWVNRAFIAAGKTGTAFDNFGGEDRFWLGPEGGQFGLYFPPGKPFEFDAWQTPHEMQEGAWDVVRATPRAIDLRRTMRVTNWSGTRMAFDVDRTVSLLSPADVAQVLGVDLGKLGNVRSVAFQSQNKITNVGDAALARATGLVSIWILAMYAPAPDARVVVPFEPGGSSRIVNDAYFGKVPAERLRVDEAKGLLVFTCDGSYRSKIGVGPARAKTRLGSYSASAKLLTIVQYDRPKEASAYVNSMWEKQTEPYGGDVVNSYNDGPTGPGKPPLGGFYELETSSPAAELAPRASLVHTHRTFHFVGEPKDLDVLARATLGASLDEITSTQR